MKEKTLEEVQKYENQEKDVEQEKERKKKKNLKREKSKLNNCKKYVKLFSPVI